MGKSRIHIDWHIVLTIFAIISFGGAVLLTINQGLFVQQLVFISIGIGLFILVTLIEPYLWQWFSPIAYVLSLLLLVSSFFGPRIRGATRWIMIGSNQLQPSEVVKPFLLLAYSYFLTRYPPKTVKALFLNAALFFIPFFLVFKQPDLGSSIVYAVMFFAMMFAAGAPLLLFIALPTIFVVSFPVLWHFLTDYQQNRILTFLAPNLDPAGNGYNALQSMIAVGSGTFFGRGLGMGTQSHLRFLPEFHTDFIFATLVEELGFLGGAILLLLYCYLLWRVISPYVTGQKTLAFTYIFSVGLFTMLLTQICINSGMNMGIIPITGITLPLVSYGGSSVLSVFTSFGILGSLKRQER